MIRKTASAIIIVLIIGSPLFAASKTPAQMRQELLVKVEKNFEPLLQPLKGQDVQFDWTNCRILVKTETKLDGDSKEDFQKGLDVSSLKAVQEADKILTPPLVGSGVILGQKPVNHNDIADILMPVKQSLNEKTRVLTAVYGVDIFGSDGLLPAKGVKFKKTKNKYSYVGDGNCDGVVIDARTCKVEAAATLTVLTYGKQVVFSQDMLKGENSDKLQFPPAIYVYMKHSGKVNPDAQSLLMRPIARAQQVVQQSGTADSKLAQQLKGVFRNPLIINAEPSVKHDTPGLIVLANGSEKELIMHSEALELFQQGKVLVVTDVTYGLEEKSKKPQ